MFVEICCLCLSRNDVVLLMIVVCFVVSIWFCCCMLLGLLYVVGVMCLFICFVGLLLAFLFWC